MVTRLHDMIEAERYLKERVESLLVKQPTPMELHGGQRCRSSNANVSIYRLACLALLSGLFGFACAFLRELGAVIPEALAAILVAPPIEEVLKIAIPIIILEHRTKWLDRGQDLLWFAMGSALVFAIAENLMYSFVFLEDPSAGLLWWRWIVCTAMHVGASGLSGVGLMRAYTRGLDSGQPPRFIWEWPWLAGAIAVHMAYNSFAVFAGTF